MMEYCVEHYHCFIKQCDIHKVALGILLARLYQHLCLEIPFRQPVALNRTVTV